MMSIDVNKGKLRHRIIWRKEHPNWHVVCAKISIEVYSNVHRVLVTSHDIDILPIHMYVQ